MNLKHIASLLVICAGAFVAGSEIFDLFIDEAKFTTDHFFLGISVIAIALKA